MILGRESLDYALLAGVLILVIALVGNLIIWEWEDRREKEIDKKADEEADRIYRGFMSKEMSGLPEEETKDHTHISDDLIIKETEHRCEIFATRKYLRTAGSDSHLHAKMESFKQRWPGDSWVTTEDDLANDSVKFLLQHVIETGKGPRPL